MLCQVCSEPIESCSCDDAISRVLAVFGSSTDPEPIAEDGDGPSLPSEPLRVIDRPEVPRLDQLGRQHGGGFSGSVPIPEKRVGAYARRATGQDGVER